MIKLTKEQCRALYTIIRLKLDYVMSEAEKEHTGISAVDEATGVLDDLQNVGLFDTSELNGAWLERPAPQERPAADE